ncbi:MULTISPECIES: type II secretion system F family protein [Gemmobacter]|jgi:tight adherence protein C|uniref:Tight adherence protein C n=2 Tax=Gemmobacter TaxID=204456 RepID=A0A2T6B6W9_9RHOB|nr:MULTISPECIES: type II secretion system F family protein [Gemmobacter]OJY33652.1 MAG: pilus assembly protein TadC [Rhodobacterales bacterium 65-51]PTX51788.1 tight adherence protein C [Gemmobacter caeni]TWJ03916.1 tight adherence protein C [Gemmobacter caeni]GHC11583.1 pilus assembly protein TadC [Gemmobacter nanjingensis]
MFDNINAMLVEAFGPLGPVIVLLALGILLAAATLPTLMKKRSDPLDKLREQRTQRASETKAEALRQRDAADKLEKYAAFLEPQDAETMTASRLKMMRAGYRQKNAVRMFHFAQFSLGIGMLVLGFAYAMMLKTQHGNLSTQTLILYTILPAAAGYYLPQYWVQRRLQTRQQEIVQGFADALDLMLVCVEAGQSLDQCINRVAKETRAGYPALSEEFEIVSQEVKAGKERVQVLKDMAERVGVPDVASFVTTLVQSATFGTSIAEALRVYSAEMRDKRVMRAEEKANVLPTKLTLGTMLFTLPPLMIILIGPSIYGIATQLGGG